LEEGGRWVVAYLLPEMVKIHLDIRDPSMTFLHRAGVAGLFVQLKYLEYLKLQPPHGLNWSLTAQAIELDWAGKDIDALQWLFSQSFQIDPDGLIYFPAVEHSLNFKQRLAIHRNLQNSFLQHTKFFKSAGKVVREEGDREIEYRACANYAHQKATDFLCDGQGNLQSKPIKITGWIYPGTTVQHELFKATTQFTESPQHFLALLFTPLACAHVSILLNSGKQKVQNGIIVPEVIDLENCDRQSSHYRANGWADAALKFLTKAKQPNQQGIHRCLVIPFGKVAWAKQQQTRLAAETIEIDTHNLTQYNYVSRLFANNTALKFSLLLLEYDYFVGTRFLNRFLKTHHRGFNPLLELIAKNLIRGKPWWWEFADVFTQEPANRAIKLRRERLNHMVAKTNWDTEAQELFVRACHQALSITFGQISGNTKEGNRPRFDRKVIQLRSDLSRCQNAAAFRAFMSSFLGNAGKIQVLQDSWQELLPLTTGQCDWKMAKSLFYIAMASYKGKEMEPPDSDPSLETDPSITATESEA
jgi:CRISPR-associated protein Cas8a1/Csx13